MVRFYVFFESKDEGSREITIMPETTTEGVDCDKDF
jgi:hypothetical protein